MPWKIDSHHADCAGFAVVKESDGSVAGCHEIREEAEAQLRALYASEPRMSAAGGCSCPHSTTTDEDPFGEAFAASVLTAVREPNRAERRAARAGRRARRALQAAAMHDFDEPFPVPLYPPREWFSGPPTWVEPWRAAAGLAAADDGGIMRLTITDEGRIGGWFFNAGQCLVHDPTACPKHSPTRYAAFHQSDVLLDDGTMLNVGVIGMTHGHQSPWLDWKEAQRLYADPTAQKILCVAGDDQRGGWIAGAVVPGTTYGDVAMMRRSGLSGDWRPMPQSWWTDHGITPREVREVEGYDCIGPTLVTRPALPLVRNFSMDGRAAAILGGSAGIDLDVSRFARRDRERIAVFASIDPALSRFRPRESMPSRFARRAYVEWDPELHPRGEAGRFVTTGGGPEDDADAGIVSLHSGGAPGEVDTAMADLREETAQLMDRAAAADKVVTPALTELIQTLDHGAELIGLDFRLKTNEERIAQKLAEAHQKGLDDDAAIDTVADALRFTVQQDPGQYTATYTQTRDGLIAAGFTPVPGKEKNFWEPGDAYQGFNTQWRSPDGQKFELQFHTPDSFRVKDEIHKMFEEYRTSDNNERKRELWDEMTNRWEQVEIPDGILDHGELQLSGARTAALDRPTRYFITDQGKVFRQRFEDGGLWMEQQEPDGSWVENDDLLLYLIGEDTGYDEIPEPPAQQAAVSRFARRAYVFDEEAHPRDTGGRFTFKDGGGLGDHVPSRKDDPYGGILPGEKSRAHLVFRDKGKEAARRRENIQNSIGRWDFGHPPETPPMERYTPVTLPNRVSLYPDNVQAIIDANPRMSGEDDFAYQGRIVQGLDPQSQSDVIWAMRETPDPVDYLAEGLARWNDEHGLPPLPNDIVDTPVDIAEADAVARFFETAQDQSNDPAVRAAYDDFKRQNEEMYDYMTRPAAQGGLGVKVEFTDETDPYPSAQAQADDLAENHRIVIERGLGGDHSMLTQDEYDRFRAVHDVFGHAAIGGGFDRHGEYEAWLAHAAMYTDPGRQAMSTEYHGVNSAAWSGEPGTPGTGKAVLLPNDYGTPPWERDQAAQQPIAAAAVPREGTPPEVAQLIDALGLQPGFAQAFDHPAWHERQPVLAGVSDLKGPLGAEAKPRKVNPNGRYVRRSATSRFARRAYAFNEEDHPRDQGGRFTFADGGSAPDAAPETSGGGKDGLTAQEAADKFVRGEKVTVDPNEVATFTDKIAEFLKREKEEGRQPDLNMCEVSVPGTNLFCGDNQGYTRLEMPQLSGQPEPGSKADRLEKDKDGGVDITFAFTRRLAEMGVDQSPETVPTASLKATQSELRGDKSVGIAEGIRDGKVDIEHGDRIFVSSDNYILDGHHRWAGAILNDFEDGHLGDSTMPITRVDMPIKQLVDLANEFANDMGIKPKGTTGDDGNPLAGLAKAASMLPVRAAATVRGSQEVDMDTRTIIILPNGSRVDSASIGVRVASIPIVASVVAAGDLPVAPPDTPWDETTAKANLLAAAGDDETMYAKGFLFHDDTQKGPESYYWPIADVVDGTVTVVPAAIDAALAAIDDGTIGTLTPEEKDATVAILTTYAPVPEEVPPAEAIMADLQQQMSSVQSRVNAFDEFMDGYLRERAAAVIASMISEEQPLPIAPEAPLPVA